MLPLAPRIQGADHPVAALAEYAAAIPAPGLLRRPRHAEAPVITMDAADAAGLETERVELRRDRLLSRKRWQFGLREEVVLRGPV